MAEKQIVYLGHDNEISLILQSSGTAVDLSGTTAMTLTVERITITSSNSTTQEITWNKVGYATGEVRISIGNNTSLSTGLYDSWLTLYDAGSSNGIVWGRVPMEIKQNPNTT